jgi:hypothetical protein
VFQQAGFLPAETVTVPDGRAVGRTIDDAVASVFASSLTAPHLFGDRQEDYEKRLAGDPGARLSLGLFCVRLPGNILRIWRLPAWPNPVQVRPEKPVPRHCATPGGLLSIRFRHVSTTSSLVNTHSNR